MDAVVQASVEGVTDEAVVRRLIEHAGAQVGTVYGKEGKPALRQRVSGYNNAARWSPWVILVDLDRDADCAPPLCARWLPEPAPMMCFRVAVRAVEAWLLADADEMARFLGVSRTRLPDDPERLDDPKRTMVDLARRSRRRAIREDLVPRPGSGRPVGAAYASRLIEFTESGWRPNVAAGRSDSLRRAIACVERLIHLQQGREE